jgi:hypothetical protein
MKPKGSERNRSWTTLRNYPGIYLQGLNKTMKILRIVTVLVLIRKEHPGFYTMQVEAT